MKKVLLSVVTGVVSTLLFTAAPLGFASQNSAQTASATPNPGVLWNPVNQQKLNTFFEPKVAVFDADGTLWPGDIQEEFLKWLVKNNKLVGQYSGPNTFNKYMNMCKTSHRQCYRYAVQTMTGLKLTDVKKMMAEFFNSDFKNTVYPMQLKLIKNLQAHGIQPWVVSASSQWAVEAAASTLGIPKDHIIGIRQAVKNGIVTDKIIEPVTFREGKVLAIKKYIKKQPVLVAGNSMTDYEMLQYSKDLVVLINPKAGLLADSAKSRNWIVQYWK